MSVQDLVKMQVDADAEDEMDLTTDESEDESDGGSDNLTLAEIEDQRREREHKNKMERDRRALNNIALQELRDTVKDLVPNDGGRLPRLSELVVLEAATKVLARFKDAKETHNFKCSVAEACSKIEEEKERMLDLIKKAKAKNIDLDEVPGFDHFVETHNFNEATMSYVKPRQAKRQVPNTYTVPKQKLKAGTSRRGGLRPRKPSK